MCRDFEGNIGLMLSKWGQGRHHGKILRLKWG